VPLVDGIDLDAGSRLLVVAPHPDDESLVTGALLHRAVRVGAAVHVAYLTDGENNPWAQCAYERRWAFGPAARARFGELRRREALAALAALGVGAEQVTFLHQPDQGATALLRLADVGALSSLGDVVERARPTIVVGPSVLDLHPDHNALGVMLRLVLSERRGTMHLETVVHNPALRDGGTGMVALSLDEDEQRLKASAIACHRTQMTWRRGWLRSFAGPEEAYWPAGGGGPAWPIVSVPAEDGDETTLVASLPPRFRAFGRRTILILGRETHGSLRCVQGHWPRVPSVVPIVGCRDGSRVGWARSSGPPWRESLHLSFDVLPGYRPVFAKVQRRFGFFDGEGWSPLPGHGTATTGGSV
jgi:LmbE family N-acetylglucosaminyl deacetylase